MRFCVNLIVSPLSSRIILHRTFRNSHWYFIMQRERKNRKAFILNWVNLAHMNCDLAPGSLPIWWFLSAVVDGIQFELAPLPTVFIVFFFELGILVVRKNVLLINLFWWNLLHSVFCFICSSSQLRSFLFCNDDTIVYAHENNDPL